MSYCIYKLIREPSGGSASGAYKINREEEWRLAKVNKKDLETMQAELMRLTAGDPEWLRWNYDINVMPRFVKNPDTIHKRTYHLVDRGGLDELRKKIKQMLLKDGIEVL
jgi:hypothetical protein